MRADQREHLPAADAGRGDKEGGSLQDSVNRPEEVLGGDQAGGWRGENGHSSGGGVRSNEIEGTMVQVRLEDQVHQLREELGQKEKLVGYLQSVVQPKQMQKLRSA